MSHLSVHSTLSSLVHARPSLVLFICSVFLHSPSRFLTLVTGNLLVHMLQIQHILVFICNLIKTCFAAFYSCTFLCKCIALILIVNFLPHPCCSIRVSLHPVCCSCLLQNIPVCFPCIFLVHTTSGIHAPCFQLPNTTGLPEPLVCVPCVPV